MAETPTPKIFHALFLLCGLVIAIAAYREMTREEVEPVEVLQRPDPIRHWPNLADADNVDVRKMQFFGLLKPLVDYENARLRQERAQLMALYADRDQLTEHQQQQLSRLAARFKTPVPEVNTQWHRLLRRVDELPVALVLVQAANESAWGTSRFAVKGNNLFGQWCFKRGCGLVPRARSEAAQHEVKRFSTVLASVQSYMNNLNTHRAYFQLRQRRAQLRAAGETISALALASALQNYSQRGQAYVRELKAMIRINRPLIEQLTPVEMP